MTTAKPKRQTLSRRRSAVRASPKPVSPSPGDALLRTAHTFAKAKRYAEAEPLFRAWLLHLAARAPIDAVLDALDEQLFVMTRLGRREEQLAFEQEHFRKYLICDSVDPCPDPVPRPVTRRRSSRA